MKKVNLSTLLMQLSALFSLLCMVSMGFDFDIVSAVFGLSTGATSTGLAITSIAGGVKEDTYSEDLTERDVDDIVVKYKPDRFPLTTVQNEMQTAKACAQRKYEWVEIGYFPRSTTTTAGITGASNASEVFTVADVNMWGRGDLVYIPTITHGSPAVQFRGAVIAVDNANDQITVKAVTGDNTVPTVPSSTTIYRQSRGATATDAQADPQGTQGATLWNYNQTFILQLEMEKLLKKMKRYVNDEEVQHDLAIFDYRNSLENAFLFGPRAKVYDPNKKKDVYYAGGIENFAGQSDTYSGAGGIDRAKWVSLTKKMFSGNAGNETRLLVGGQDFIESVINSPSVEKQLEAKETEVKLGINVNVISTNFGQVYLKYHKGFDEMGRKGDGFALDMEYICERILEPMEEVELDLDKTGQRRVDATRMIKTSTLQVRYPDTHMVISRV